MAREPASEPTPSAELRERTGRPQGNYFFLKAIVKTKEWREYVSQGAGTFNLETVKAIFRADIRDSVTGKPDLEALRNKAIAVMMLTFGSHAKDIYKIKETDVDDRSDHRDRQGFHRPKMLFRSVHTKCPWIPTHNRAVDLHTFEPINNANSFEFA
jgi:hypothetical protein